GSEGEDIFNGELTKSDFQTVVEHLLTRADVEIIACGKNSAYTLKRYNDALKAVAAMYYHRLEFVDNFNNINDVFFKFGLNITDERIPEVQAALHDAIGDIMVPVHTGYGSIDLIIPGVHKANGLRLLQQRWGIHDSEVVVFGDGGNDIEMLRQAGFSFAMSHASEAVAAAAKYRAGSNNQEGVLDIIDSVLNNEPPFNI
ncbi:HAD hydrolase family protein, partial [Salmonella enterica]|nr:HAD hydrolase family protein [Salmonella enterica]